jgi:hypothetical protein
VLTIPAMINNNKTQLKPQIESIVTKISRPVIGLGYIIEIMSLTGTQPSFTCVLCSVKNLQVKGVDNHIVSKGHVENYLVN